MANLVESADIEEVAILKSKMIAYETEIQSLTADKVLVEQDFDETELRKVDVRITRLRQKIETNAKQPQFIKTIRGKGYKLICNNL